ncbi:DUF2064 domain-containing protein [Streptomyces sp. NPDC048551]|uniref:TIGR04282 family arsenosugar biosynthesis glycosyltransferase n=1 Tax=Streptomyces sp. NPDC048551 TaxID=3155758 RepID=UPI0034175FBA
MLILAKEPVPGRVKTRLTPPYTPQEAALLARAMLTDSLDALLAAPVGRRLLVLEGNPGPWLPPGIEVAAQGHGRLDERLAAAFGLCTGPAVLIGVDTPQVTPAVLAPALAEDAWRGCDAWFGPAADGGFWALGLAEPDPELLRGVPMDVPDTCTLLVDPDRADPAPWDRPRPALGRGAPLSRSPRRGSPHRSRRQ